jgi:hypothetical protein
MMLARTMSAGGMIFPRSVTKTDSRLSGKALAGQFAGR